MLKNWIGTAGKEKWNVACKDAYQCEKVSHVLRECSV